MRIAMISTPFVAVPPADYGGTELVVHELTEGLHERDHRVTLFATGDSSTSAELRYRFRTAQWPPDIMTDLCHVSWAMTQLRAEAFDLVHVHSASALAFGAMLPDLPMVYTLHHVRDETLSAFYGSFREPYYVAISAAQAKREILLPRLEVIHHGLSPGKYEYSEVAGEYVAFIGRFAEVKGAHTAIDVAREAGIPIRVAGQTHEVDREFAAREVEPRLAQPHVEYLGCLDMAGKVPLLRDARALLCPIDWEEPFGLVLIEAMLSGCPPIAFPRGSVPELVEHGVTGFVVRDAQEMTELLRDRDTLERFDRLRCRRLAVERFGRERMVASHERLYRRILHERAPQKAGRVVSAGAA